MLDSLLHKGKRRKLVKEISTRFAYDKEVLRAIENVPRHLFVEIGLDYLAYEDKPLPIASGQTISQPSTVAMQTHLARLQPGDRVLEIGTGCGYQTAVLVEMGMKVYSIERQKALYLAAQRNLARLEYYSPLLVLGDGYAGLPRFAPFKAIVITCGAPEIPRELLLQLEIGGRMVVPVGETEGQQELLVIQRKNEIEFDKTVHGKCSFVPMLGGVCK